MEQIEKTWTNETIYNIYNKLHWFCNSRIYHREFQHFLMVFCLLTVYVYLWIHTFSSIPYRLERLLQIKEIIC